MAYNDLHVQMAYDGEYNDITSFARHEEKVRITRGLANESSRSAATDMSLTLNNPDRQFSWQHPLSPLYRKIGQGTLLRTFVGTPHVGAADGSGTDSVSHVAPSVVAPTADGLLMCMWGTTTEVTYTIPGSMTAHGGTLQAQGSAIAAGYQQISSVGATGTRTATPSVSTPFAAASVLLHGTSLVVEPQGIIGSAVRGGFTFSFGPVERGWWIVLIEHMAFGEIDELRLPSFPRTNQGGWILLADSGTVSTPGGTTDPLMRMKAWARRVKTDGTFIIGMQAANLHMTRIFAVSGVGPFSIRATTEISSAPPRRDTSGRHRTMPVTASGVLRRLGGSRYRPLRSALHQEITHAPATIVAYWPCEDGSGATELASALPDAPAMTALTLADVQLADSAAFGGSEPLPTLGAAGNIRGNIPAHTPTGFVLARGCYSIPAAGATDQASLLGLRFVPVAANFARLRVQYLTGGSVRLQTLDIDDAVIATGSTHAADLDGRDVLIELNLRQDSGPTQLFYQLSVWVAGQVRSHGAYLAHGDFTGAFSGASMGRVSRLGAGGVAGAGAGLADVACGHFAVSVSTFVTAGAGAGSGLNAMRDALDGYAGEAPDERIERLCIQHGIDVSIVGLRDLGTPMGAQRPGTLLGLLREAEQVGAGILYEPREFLGLAYRARTGTRAGLYNQDPVATVDGATGQLAEWTPTPDDRLIENDVTTSRRDGSSARSVQETGPLNIQDRADDPDGVGPYPVSQEYAVRSDGVLGNIAGWRRLRGTIDEPRFPALATDLVREQEITQDPALVASLADLDVGDRLVVTNPPDDVPPDDVSQLAVGFAEVLTGHEWSIAANVVPESPYHIAEVEHELYSVIGSDAASTAEALDTTETGVDISAGAGPDWVHEVDYDIEIGGERMTVTAVAAMAGTFPARTTTLTVVRSVNGVVKAHATGTPVEFFHKAYIGL